ncbi:cyclase family protein [Leucobacter luti]|uniref:cyclase family protein n=1 Tax=Leucobacter luti TaxID=340320 RepID=UPI003D0840AD
MIDLSHRITSGMTVFPGDPEVTTGPALTLARDGVAVERLELGSHTGTHVDAPAHTIAGGRTIDRVSLDELTGEALVLEAAAGAEIAERSGIGAAALGLGELARVPPIVLIRTGWDRRFGEASYLRHPHLEAEAAERLLELGMRVLGVDFLNPDPTPGPGEEADFPVHAAVLGADGLIVENLRGLEQLGRTARVGFFPLPLAGGDGAPVRAVAW